MQNRQDIVLPTCSLQLGERAYITTGWQNAQKYVSKISEKSHFEIRHYAMPCHGRNRKLSTRVHNYVHVPFSL